MGGETSIRILWLGVSLCLHVGGVLALGSVSGSGGREDLSLPLEIPVSIEMRFAPEALPDLNFDDLPSPEPISSVEQPVSPVADIPAFRVSRKPEYRKPNVRPKTTITPTPSLVLRKRGAGLKETEESYAAKIVRHIERHKYYPRSARLRGQEGKVVVSFSIGTAGSLHGERVDKSSGFHLLDRAALETLRRSVPFPVREGGINPASFHIPIRYALREK